jgi:putative toxin-antitoxin system antitoxin component (TIGR02293 family)
MGYAGFTPLDVPMPQTPPHRKVSGGERGEGLGLASSSAAELIQQVERGFSYKTLHTFESKSGIPSPALAGMAGIPERTLARRKAKGKFTPEESERLLRLSTVFELAVELFEGDNAAALRWLTAPRKALEGNTPLAYARTEVGAREVENLIGRLEEGVFS